MNYAETFGFDMPLAVVTPRNPDEVMEIVASAAEAGKAVIPWGGGTAQTYGYAPTRADVALDMTAMNRIIAHEPGDLTVTVEAGATLDSLQEVLSRHNQFLPLDPPHAARATIGGILATNAFGAGSAGYGAARDWLIGITVVDAQGRTVRGGGKVVKNVTGYDLPKLHVGALGTLGVIVEATFKVAPRPDASQPLVFVLPPSEPAGEAGASGAAGLIEEILRETSPSLALLREESGSRALVLVYSGIDAVVVYESERAVQIGSARGSGPSSALPAGMRRPFTGGLPDGAPLIARVAGLREGAWERHVSLSAMGCWELIDTLPVTGHADCYLRPDADPVSAAQALLSWSASNAVPVALLHAPLELRTNRDFPLWSPLPPSLPIMRRLKESLDPQGILNPGRFIGGL